MTARRVLLVLIAAAMLAWSPGASAQDLNSFRVEIDYSIEPDGTGMLSAFTGPNFTVRYEQRGSITWMACPPGGVCSPIASDPRSDRLLHVGDAAVGTVFVATAVNGSQVASATSIPYLGRVRLIAPPRIKGEPRVGALVQPLVGSWSGGWGHEHSYLQTQVCRTPGGSRCLVVADLFYWNHCHGWGAVLTPAQRGQYVRVIDARLGMNTPGSPLDEPWSPAGLLRPLQLGPKAAAALAGPIAPARGPPESDCGQAPGPPSAVLAAHPARRQGRLVLGRIYCGPLRCLVYVTVRQRKRRVRLARSFYARVAPWRLRLPARLARRLKPGLATVSVVNRWLVAERHTLSRRRVTLPRL